MGRNFYGANVRSQFFGWEIQPVFRKSLGAELVQLVGREIWEAAENHHAVVGIDHFVAVLIAFDDNAEVTPRLSSGEQRFVAHRMLLS